MAHALEAATLPRKAIRQKTKARKKALKQEKKRHAQEGDGRRRIYVLNFHGDLRGTEVAPLREEITAVLTTARPADEVVLRLESTGGLVHAYGLGASQLQRIKDKGIPLTVSVDKVAASGGYLMACVANKIIAAPFSVIGSIGVLAQLPNFHRLLKKHDVDFEQFTAGEYKRTVTVVRRDHGQGPAEAERGGAGDPRVVQGFRSAASGPSSTWTRSAPASTGSLPGHWSSVWWTSCAPATTTCSAPSDGADIYEVTYTAKQNVIEKLSTLVAGRLGRRPTLPGSGAERTYLV